MAGDRDGERKPKAVSRRGLLRGGATIGVAAAAGSAAGDAAGAETVDRPDDPRRLTYRETDHIRAFYRRSRI